MSRQQQARRRPCDLIPDAEEAAATAAAATVKARSHLPQNTRTRQPIPRLLIRDPDMAVWLINDGRAQMVGRDQVRLLTTKAHLIGLSDVDLHDPVVLDAYLTTFARILGAAGYRSRIETT